MLERKRTEKSRATDHQLVDDVRAQYELGLIMLSLPSSSSTHPYCPSSAAGQRARWLPCRASASGEGLVDSIDSPIFHFLLFFSISRLIHSQLDANEYEIWNIVSGTAKAEQASWGISLPSMCILAVSLRILNLSLARSLARCFVRQNSESNVHRKIVVAFRRKTNSNAKNWRSDFRCTLSVACVTLLHTNATIYWIFSMSVNGMFVTSGQ